MKNFSPTMDNLHFQITYTFGHLYFDRCGQCLNDIERTCEGWLTTSVNQLTGALERPEKSFILNFNNTQFTFSARKASETDIKDIAKEVSNLWKIIQANLGLDEILRIGCRINYLLATKSVEASEKHLQKAELNVKMPENLLQTD